MDAMATNSPSQVQAALFQEPIKKGTILVVDDQKGFRKVYRDLLEHDGYDVLEAVDGEEGWEVVMNQKPSLVLLDLGLPLLDGFQVLEKMRRSEQAKAIPVIIFSVLGEPRDVKRAMEMGANDYTVKGFYTPRQVLGKIKNLLSESGHRNNTNSYKTVLQGQSRDASRLEQDLGLEKDFKCPSCGEKMDVEFFPDYARADGHWFAARFICPACDKPF